MRKSYKILSLSFVATLSSAVLIWTNIDEQPLSNISPSLETTSANQSQSSLAEVQPEVQPAELKNQSGEAKPKGRSEVATTIESNAPSAAANREFEALSPTEKTQRRMSSLQKILAGEAMDEGDIVAVQRPWEKVGSAPPRRVGYRQPETVGVNGNSITVGIPGKVVADTVLVKMRADVAGQKAVLQLQSVAGFVSVEPMFKNPNSALATWHEIRFTAPAEKVAGIASALESFEGVVLAEPAYERATSGIPDATTDPLLNDQWHLNTAKVDDAWNYLDLNGLTPGGSEYITVAVIDTGVDYSHPDLVGNMWVNALEIPDNGIDDDGNGFVDDVHGVSVVGSNGSHSGNPADDHGHGTHVAGIIAAAADNGLGGTGIAYNAKIMAIKAAQYSGLLTTADIAEAIYYAVDNGADVINMSFGGYGRSQVEEDALVLAYAQAVLVAAAGNDGKANQPCPAVGSPMYPAAHPWVLGVMASGQVPDDQGDYLASFSNWDCRADNGLEYEVMAPGVGIWSTLPNDGYAAWSGTSMAAPVVSGIAALLRTKWADKAVYSSRFIMGQLAATGTMTQAFTPLVGLPVSYRQLDALQALTFTPEPQLTYEEHWLFDGLTQSPLNDNDGRIDAGETVELAIVLRNRWGKADNVTATLSTPSGASGADPYVTMINPSVDYGAIGSFNKDDNGLQFDEGLLVTGVANPFIIQVAAETPNNHVIPVTLTMTATNGLDPEGGGNYTFVSNFQLTVQRGRELPSIIDGDAPGTDGGTMDTDGIEDGIVTLDDSALWIVDKPVLVTVDTTLRVTAGAELQFWGSLPDAAYTVFQNAYLQVEGGLDIIGEPGSPVIMKPSELHPHRAVVINPKDNSIVSFRHAEITNLFDQPSYGQMRGIESFGNVYRRSSHQYGYIYTEIQGASDWRIELFPSFRLKYSDSDQFVRLGGTYFYHREDQKNHGMAFSLNADNVTRALFDNVSLGDNSGFASVDSVYLKNTQRAETNYGLLYYGSQQTNVVPVADAAVFEPVEYNGKTYFLLHYQGDQNHKIDGIDYSRAFARELGGYLFTVSDEAEVTYIANWLLGVSSKTSDEWKSTYPLCESNDPEDQFCNDLDFGTVGMGLLRQADDTYAWDSGESPAYNFLETQLYWDRVAYKLSQGWTPDANDYDWERKAPIGSLQASGTFGYSMLSHRLGYDDSWYTPDNFIIEVDGTHTQAELETALATFKANYSQGGFSNNAILNVWHDLNPNHWLTFKAPSGDASRRWNYQMDIRNNYWGGAGDALIDIATTDFSDDFNLARAPHEPALTEAPATAYPFVVNVQLTDQGGGTPPGNRFGTEPTRWTITFNRDMDVSKQPFVSFGPADPFTDFAVPGDWADARTWQGGFDITPVTGDGWQNVRVVGAVAADAPWLVTGDDSERFRFEIITSGTEALNLQASGGAGQVSLDWVQDDFILLHGFNIYRSLTADGSFDRVNDSVVGKSQSAFVDTEVVPGVPHYYYFTVVIDGGESEPSNLAMATPVDTILPFISHTLLPVLLQGESVTLRATVTDNIGVQSVRLLYRVPGDVAWLARDMLETADDRYAVSLEGSLVNAPGLEYLIEVKDAVNTVTSVAESTPSTLTVVDPNGEDDYDGDGFSNAMETAQGTNLLDATSYPDIMPPVVSPPLGLLLSVVAGSDVSFALDKPEIAAFLTAASAVDETDGNIDVIIHDAPNSIGMGEVTVTFSATDSSGNVGTATSTITVSAYRGVQRIAGALPNINLPPGLAATLPISYTVSDDNATLPGLGLRIHFNSSWLQWNGLSQVLNQDLILQDYGTRQDVDDLDNDPSTDRYVAIAWASLQGDWPGNLPVSLFNLNVHIPEQLALGEQTTIRFTSADTAAGYGFESTPVTITTAMNLDIDNNGQVKALEDGLIIMRYLFGFPQGDLFANLLPGNGLRGQSEMLYYLGQAEAQILDVDGNGEAKALTDGLLIIRYLFFGESFAVDDVVASDCQRCDATTISDYLSKVLP